MAFTRLNALDQALDIAGSLTQSQNLTLSDEPIGYGAPISSQSGSAATISAQSGTTTTLTGLTGMTAQSVGRMLSVSNAANSANNGTFLIIAYNSSSSVDILNVTPGVFPDANSGSLVWTERQPYSLEDDLNYVRTDRKLIKGTSNFYDAVPTYQRLTAVGTNVPANLTNIAGKTTDAVAYNVNRAFFNVSVSPTNTKVTLTSAGNFKHADSVDRTGVPCFDTGPFSGDWTSCYVHIVDGYSSGSELTVLSGPNAGERIFGITKAGSSTSPNSIEIEFYSSPFNVDYTVTQNPYTWESGQVGTINVLYGFNERLDQLDANAFRTVPALGILTDATLANDLNNLQQVVGVTDGYTSLSGLLTNTVANYVFYNLPDATPSVVEALNTINSQIGDRTYTGSYLTSGQTVAQSLQALSTAISATSSVTRIVERLNADINPGTAHTLPGGASYIVDGLNNGLHLWVYWRGLLRDPGPVSSGNDYSETSTTQVTFYSKLKSGDHINYFIRS